MKRVVAYHGRPPIPFGYNMGGRFDAAHIDMAKAGGATLLRVQFGWEGVEDCVTGGLLLPAPFQQFLVDCAARNVKPVILAAYGSPRVTLGSVVLTANVPAGTPAGTPIGVKPHGLTFDYPYCFVGGAFFGGGVTNKSAYYGSLITAATTSTITLAAATSVPLTAGRSLPVQRLRYSPLASDIDPGNAAYVRYATFIAEQIAAAGAQGYVEIWNEYPWFGDRWETLGAFYDSPPTSTLTEGMKQILVLCQQAALPFGVSFVNGVTNKSGFYAVIKQGIRVPGSIAFDAIHPYGNNPEEHAWDYYAWGFNGERTDSPTMEFNQEWWETVRPANLGSNFRYMAFINDLTTNAPDVLATECGFIGADDAIQAKYLSRRVASLWGMGIAPCLYCFDGDAEAAGAVTYAVAPQLMPRASYHTLQRMTQIVGRMATNDRIGGAAPSVIGWHSNTWPLMSTTVLGGAKHCTILMWQRTESDGSWALIESPIAVEATITIPTGTTVAEAVNVRTGLEVTITTGASTVAVPVSDDVIAIRFAPI